MRQKMIKTVTKPPPLSRRHETETHGQPLGHAAPHCTITIVAPHLCIPPASPTSFLPSSKGFQTGHLPGAPNPCFRSHFQGSEPSTYTRGPFPEGSEPPPVTIKSMRPFLRGLRTSLYRLNQKTPTLGSAIRRCSWGFAPDVVEPAVFPQTPLGRRTPL